MQSLMLVGIVIAVAGVFLSILTLMKIRQKHLMSAVSAGTFSVVVIIVGGVILLAASNLATYQRLVYEAPVAEVSFEKLSPARFNVEVYDVETGQLRRYELLGDEWQLDAQILTWHGVMTLLGLDAQYRLVRLSGRYADISQEKSAERSVHDLAPEKRFDVWTAVQKYQRWFKWADATYGSAVFLPMVDQARFNVSISRTGLVARPGNDIASRAVKGWSGL